MGTTHSASRRFHQTEPVLDEHLGESTTAQNAEKGTP